MNTSDVFRLILNNPYGSVFITDSQGIITFVNLAAQKLLGKRKEELIGKHTADLLKSGAYDYSTVLECLQNKTLAIGMLKVSQGNRIMAVSFPILDKNKNIIATVTNSFDHMIVTNYMAVLNKERQKTKHYKETIRYLSAADHLSSPIIAESPSMKSILATAKSIAETDCTVLILGESGVGKDVVSNYIHQCSPRSDEPFIPINCATIPKDLLESELFGYEKGAFTGANDKGKIGIFEMADKGTLFLDEIGELPLMLQAKFLRVLETGTMHRLGSTTAKKINFRLIAATNRNLLNMVKAGTFRDDLYYRLNVIPITLPPLRERREDIVALVNVFLEKFNIKYHREKQITSNELTYFLHYNWPGNIRELQNIIERLVITDIDIPSLFSIHSHQPPFHPFPINRKNVSMTSTKPLKEYMKEVELQYIRQVIDECGGKISEAAERLGVHRTLLYKKLNSKIVSKNNL